jgi:hypothetical protein
VIGHIRYRLLTDCSAGPLRGIKEALGWLTR